MPLEEVIGLLRYAGARKEKEHEARQAISHLTGREREVLSLLAEGLEAQEIAARLHISAKTEAQPRGEHSLQARGALPPAGGHLRRTSRSR